MGLRTEEESAPLTFGKALHRGLEYWYCLPRDQRALPDKYKSDMQALQAGNAPTEPYSDGVLEALRQFVISAEVLRVLPDDDARSINNGVKTLKRYFDFYKDDPFIVHRDSEGPLIERDFEFTMLETDKLKVIYIGTIDCILRNETNDNIVVVDHKTTTRLSDLASRAATSHQVTGYIMAAQQCFNLKTDTFIINGIQVAKTVHNLQRFPTTRTSEHFESLKQAVLSAIYNYERSIENNYWPQTAPGPCANYGGCNYLEVCSVPEFLKPTILENKYGKLT